MAWKSMLEQPANRGKLREVGERMNRLSSRWPDPETIAALPATLSVLGWLRFSSG